LPQQSEGCVHEVVEQVPVQKPAVQWPLQQSASPAHIEPSCTHAGTQKNESRSQRPLQH